MQNDQRDYLPQYPPLRLDHLVRLTDSTGVLQHAVHSVPDRGHGYSIDDQARALIVLLAYARLSGMQRAPDAAYTYMSYLHFANIPSGAFHNFLSYNGVWLDDQGSEDCFGRTMWALGYASRHGIDRGLANAAADLFNNGVPQLEHLDWLRAKAFSLFGLYHRQKAEPDSRLLALVRMLADALVEQYDRTSSTEWQWFENTLTYCNAKLPAALLLAYEITGEAGYLEIGLATLTWLRGIVVNDAGVLSLVGQDGWYLRGGVKAEFDQQCVDAQGMVEAASIAYRVTGQAIWQNTARLAFDWFVGRNVHGVSLIDSVTWGCYDGITATRLNRNMGAESIVCYLLAYLELVDAGAVTLEGAVPQSE
jgi:hypothetical protein